MERKLAEAQAFAEKKKAEEEKFERYQKTYNHKLMNMWEDKEGKDSEEDKKDNLVSVVYKNGMPSLMKKLKHEKIPVVGRGPKLQLLDASKQDQLVSISLAADEDKYLFKGVDSDLYSNSSRQIDDSLPSLPDVLSKKLQHVKGKFNDKRAGKF